jgi:hypothetical protein
MKRIIAALLLAAGLTATGLATAQAGTTTPQWLHVKRTSVTHHGHPCRIVYGGRGGTSALICSDGYAETS